MQIIKKKYKFESVYGTQIFNLQGIEYPPQTRSIKFIDTDSTTKVKQMRFPYIQFVLGATCRLDDNIFSHWTTYLSFSDTSLFEGGKRYTLYLPNMDISSGWMCLGNVKVNNLKDFVDAFWIKTFSYKIHKKIFINGQRNYTIETPPNIFQAENSKKYEEYN